MNKLMLYHGSRQGLVGAIRPDRSDGACDFGRTPEAWEGDVCEMQGRLLEQAWQKDYDMAGCHLL